MNIYCIGRNYVKHIEELKNEIPEQPAVFMKPANAILEGEKFYLPSFSKEIHYETELIIKLGRKGRFISEENALEHIEAIGLGIDFTARDIQSMLKEKRLSWELSKAFTGSAVVGDFIPIDLFSSLDNIQFSLEKNGTVVQKGNSSHMIFSFEKIISFLSIYFELNPGDLIFTGTPEGVGPVEKGDLLCGFIFSNQMFEVTIQ